MILSGRNTVVMPPELKSRLEEYSTSLPYRGGPLVEMNSGITEEEGRKSKVLVVDDEVKICEVIKDIISLWKLDTENFSDPLLALQRAREVDFDVVLLDVIMPELSGFDLMSQIKKYNSEAKIIIMTGYSDKDTAITALRKGAFDFLEKPVEANFLKHSIFRALEALEQERSIKRLYDDLQKSQWEVIAHSRQVEELNNKLLETNKALSVLAQNIEHERSEMEKRIAIKLKSLIIPSIKNLIQDITLEKYHHELNFVISQIEDITTGFTQDATIASSLSFTEIRIASLIKNGLTTDQIADQLNISESTVRTHRKNIRKKLKINNTNFSLRNYLCRK